MAQVASKTDNHIEIAHIQKEIQDFLGLKSEEVVFEFSPFEGSTKVDLITINARHNQSFLFNSVLGVDKTDALEKLFTYVKTHREKEASFTIQWMERGSRDLQTSYFRAKHMYDALDKLYYDRDMNQLTVFSVVLNPLVQW